MLGNRVQICWLAKTCLTLLALMQYARSCCQAPRQLLGLLLQPLPRRGTRLRPPLLMQSPRRCTFWAPSSKSSPSLQVVTLLLQLDVLGICFKPSTFIDLLDFACDQCHMGLCLCTDLLHTCWTEQLSCLAQ